MIGSCNSDIKPFQLTTLNVMGALPDLSNVSIEIYHGKFRSHALNAGPYKTRTTTAARTLFKNRSSRYSYHFETISCRFALKMCSNIPQFGLSRLRWALFEDLFMHPFPPSPPPPVLGKGGELTEHQGEKHRFPHLLGRNWNQIPLPNFDITPMSASGTEPLSTWCCCNPHSLKVKPLYWAVFLSGRVHQKHTMIFQGPKRMINDSIYPLVFLFSRRKLLI